MNTTASTVWAPWARLVDRVRPIAIRPAAFSLPLVLVGGWMTAYPGAMLAAPLVIVCGLAAARVTHISRLPSAQRNVVLVGLALAALLSVGAARQFALGMDDTKWMAAAFAGSMTVLALTAALPATVLRSAWPLLRTAALGMAAWNGYQAFFTDISRASGPFGLNANAAAAFLLIVGTQWLTEKGGRTWPVFAVSILFLAMVPSYSRWTMGVLCVALLLLRVQRSIGWRALALLSLAPALYATLIFTGTNAAQPDRVTASAPLVEHIEQQTHDIQSRIGPLFDGQAWSVLSTMPWGFLSNQWGLGADPDGGHNLFLRLSAETGIVGLSLFCWMLWAIWRRAMNGSRLVLALFVLLGMMDYYMWGPFQIAPLLWAVLAMGATERRSETAVNP